ncbi:MAG: hypothetical protein ACK4IK_01780 [Bacteroidia bacterium]
MYVSACSNVIYGLFSKSANRLTPAANTAAQAAAAWYRGGNTISNGNNIFGTMWNSPIYMVTSGTLRTKLNGNIGYTINGFAAQQKNGAFLIADGQFPINGGFYTNGFGAFSLLHISGNNGTFVQQEGYRPWMHAGVTF